MVDYCVLCFTEAVDSDGWFYSKEIAEHICLACYNEITEMIVQGKLKFGD